MTGISSLISLKGKIRRQLRRLSMREINGLGQMRSRLRRRTSRGNSRMFRRFAIQLLLRCIRSTVDSNSKVEAMRRRPMRSCEVLKIDKYSITLN